MRFRRVAKKALLFGPMCELESRMLHLLYVHIVLLKVARALWHASSTRSVAVLDMLLRIYGARERKTCFPFCSQININVKLAKDFGVFCRLNR